MIAFVFEPDKRYFEVELTSDCYSVCMAMLKFAELRGDSRPVFIRLCPVSFIFLEEFFGLRVTSSCSVRKSKYDTL